PGTLGFYGFRNRKDHSYDGLTFATAEKMKEDRVWDILSRAGKHVVVLGVPQTFPPSAVNGQMVGCFLSPSIKSRYTYPDALRDDYRYLYAEIGSLIEGLDDDTALMVVSDHGAQSMIGGIQVNEWLMREGYLSLAEQPTAPGPIGKMKIDWPNTRVWADGGYY